MSIAGHMEAGLRVLLGVKGETVTYTPVGGEGREILASVTLRDMQSEEGRERRSTVRRCKVSVLRDAEAGVEVVTVGRDTVEIGGELYTVMAVGNESAGHFDLHCEREVTASVRQPGRMAGR